MCIVYRPIATFHSHAPTIVPPPSQLISGHLEEAASELDEIPRLHVLPTEGREYLEGLEVRRGEGSGRVTGVEWQGELGGRVTSVIWGGEVGGG